MKIALTLLQMRIIGVKQRIRNNQGQLFYVHEQPPEVLLSQCCHINHVPAISEHPKIP